MGGEKLAWRRKAAPKLTIQSSDLVKAIETAIPVTVIRTGDLLKAAALSPRAGSALAEPALCAYAIASTHKLMRNAHGLLPAQLVVSLVIAISLWSRDSMRDVLFLIFPP